MTPNLKIAKEKYEKGDIYYSASKNLKSKLVVEGKIQHGTENSENIYCSSGLLYDALMNEWAEKL